MSETGPSHGISVVLPCLNEAESIVEAIGLARRGIEDTGLDGEVIVVDNGSSDGSPDLAREHGARVLFEEERGYGAALRKGFASARYAVIVMGDADTTYDFSKLGNLVQPILDGEADLVVGNRMNNIQPGAMPALHRYIGNPILSLMLRVMFHSHTIKDAHCGMRAISRASYRSLGCVTTGMEFASEMIVRAIHCKLRMQERDIVYHPRVGESKLVSFRDGWRHLRFMVLHSPTASILMPGILFWLIGSAMVVPLAFGPITIDDRVVDVHVMIIGGLLNTISMQFIMTGLLAKAYAHVSRLRHDPTIAWLYGHATFEKVIAAAAPLLLAGLGMTLWVVFKWVASDFGPLDETRFLFLAMLCLLNGTQVAASGYLFSIMALPRHIEPFEPTP